MSEVIIYCLIKYYGLLLEALGSLSFNYYVLGIIVFFISSIIYSKSKTLDNDAIVTLIFLSVVWIFPLSVIYTLLPLFVCVEILYVIYLLISKAYDRYELFKIIKNRNKHCKFCGSKEIKREGNEFIYECGGSSDFGTGEYESTKISRCK